MSLAASPGEDRPGLFPIVLAILVTGALAWVTARFSALPESDPGPVDWLIPLLLVMPFAVAALWGWALVTGRPRRLAVGAAAGLLVLGLSTLPQDVVWQVAGNVAAGLAAGLAIGARWRIDAAVVAVTACLAPVLIWSALQMPLDRTLDEFGEATLQSMDDTLWQDLDADQKELARKREEDRLAEATAVMKKVFPALLAIGVLGQAGIILALVAWLIRLSGLSPGLSGFAEGESSFVRWRLPFYLVWILVGGLGLVLTRQPALSTAGLNVVLVTGLLIAIQGLSLQAFFVSRLLPGPVQVVFWLVMGIPLVGMLMVSSVVLGLADQWMDLRRRYLAQGSE